MFELPAENNKPHVVEVNKTVSKTGTPTVSESLEFFNLGGH